MFEREMLKYLRTSDLPNEFQRMARHVGLETTINVVNEFAGETIHVPRIIAPPPLVVRLVESGWDRRQICDTLEISKSTYYRILNQ